MNIEKKRAHEIQVLSEMIDLYARNHAINCDDLKQYAIKRTSCCPFMEQKTFCSACKVHCYKAEYRIKIKEIMRYSGPRLFFTHPILVLRHGLLSLEQKMKGASQ